MELKLQSDEIDKLTTAFVEARKEFDFVKLDGRAHHGGYVSLDEIKFCTNGALLKHGLSLTQTRSFNENHVFLVTKLTHTSGQWLASYAPLYVPENPKSIDQAYGSAVTYARRYELYGLFSIKGEDLDPDSLDNPQNKSMPNGSISAAQLGFLKALLKDQTQREAQLCSGFKIDNLSQLPREYMDEVVSILKQKAA